MHAIDSTRVADARHLLEFSATPGKRCQNAQDWRSAYVWLVDHATTADERLALPVLRRLMQEVTK